MTERVFVTGLGVVSGFGDALETFWADCLAGRSLVEPIPPHWRNFANLHSAIWSPTKIPVSPDLFSRVESLQHDPATLMAIGAAQSALTHAGFAVEVGDRKTNSRRIPALEPFRSACFVGTGIGGANSFMVNHAYQVLANSSRELTALCDRVEDDELRKDVEHVLTMMGHANRFNPFVVSMLMPNAPASYLGIKFGLRGGSTPCNYACASGTIAIGRAFESVRAGHIDTAIAGGTEYLDDPHGSIFHGFDVCGALVRDCEEPERANRPFDEKRSGFLFSQGGAGMLVLESERQVMARNVEPIAEILGSGLSFDAFNMMRPDPQGEAIERMLRDMLAAAEVAAQDVDYINAHGTGTENNDACEAAVIERLFGSEVAVNSTKSLLGHSMGASGAIEAVVTALSLRDQRLHPSRNIQVPVADLGFVRSAEERSVRVAVSQSFAFGGHNAALLMARPH